MAIFILRGSAVHKLLQLLVIQSWLAAGFKVIEIPALLTVSQLALKSSTSLSYSQQSTGFQVIDISAFLTVSHGVFKHCLILLTSILYPE